MRIDLEQDTGSLETVLNDTLGIDRLSREIDAIHQGGGVERLATASMMGLEESDGAEQLQAHWNA